MFVPRSTAATRVTCAGYDRGQPPNESSDVLHRGAGALRARASERGAARRSPRARRRRPAHSIFCDIALDGLLELAASVRPTSPLKRSDRAQNGARAGTRRPRRPRREHEQDRAQSGRGAGSGDASNAHVTDCDCRRAGGAILERRDAGWSSQVARRAHNPEVAGSNPAPATRKARSAGLFLSQVHRANALRFRSRHRQPGEVAAVAVDDVDVAGEGRRAGAEDDLAPVG